jgi:uncharacterized protein involved in exopolysaccharide biosynthesis
MSTPGENGLNDRFESDMFDLGGFLRILTTAIRHHKFLVLFTCFLTLVVVTWYVWVWPPIYLVEAQLAAERALDPARDVFYSNWQVFRKEDARDEVVLFTAGPVLRDVIAKNNLKYDDVYHPFMSHAGYLWEKSWLGKKYTALKESIFKPDVNAPDDEAKEMGRVLDDLKSGIYFASEADTHVATLQVKGPNRKVTDIANSLIDSYLAYRSKRHADEARTALNVLTVEAERARGELELVRARRESFARRNGLMVDFQKESLDVKELTGIETGISNQKAKVASLEASIGEIDAQLAVESPMKVLSSTKELNAIRENANIRRLDLQTTLIGLRNRYREDSPEVQEVLADIQKLDSLIAQQPEHVDRNVTEGVNSVYTQLVTNRAQLQAELKGARAALENMAETQGAMQGRLTELPTTMSLAQNLNRDYDIAAEKYQRLLFRKIEAEVSATASEAAPASVKVIEYASAPTSKYWPRMKYLYPGAVVVGLVLGSIAALLRSLTAGRLLRSHMDRGRIATPVYATLALRNSRSSLTVLPRQAALPDASSSSPPKEEADRSRSAGA